MENCYLGNVVLVWQIKQVVLIICLAYLRVMQVNGVLGA